MRTNKAQVASAGSELANGEFHLSQPLVLRTARATVHDCVLHVVGPGDTALVVLAEGVSISGVSVTFGQPAGARNA